MYLIFCKISFDELPGFTFLFSQFIIVSGVTSIVNPLVEHRVITGVVDELARQSSGRACSSKKSKASFATTDKNGTVSRVTYLLP